MKERTESQRAAFTAAAEKNLSLERLTNKSISRGIFIKPGSDNEYYSTAWVLNRLRHNDDRVAKKLVKYAATL